MVNSLSNSQPLHNKQVQFSGDSFADVANQPGQYSSPTNDPTSSTGPQINKGPSQDTFGAPEVAEEPKKHSIVKWVALAAGATVAGFVMYRGHNTAGGFFKQHFINGFKMGESYKKACNYVKFNKEGKATLFHKGKEKYKTFEDKLKYEVIDGELKVSLSPEGEKMTEKEQTALLNKAHKAVVNYCPNKIDGKEITKINVQGKKVLNNADEINAEVENLKKPKKERVDNNAATSTTTSSSTSTTSNTSTTSTPQSGSKPIPDSSEVAQENKSPTLWERGKSWLTSLTSKKSEVKTPVEKAPATTSTTSSSQSGSEEPMKVFYADENGGLHEKPSSNLLQWKNTVGSVIGSVATGLRSTASSVSESVATKLRSTVSSVSESVTTGLRSAVSFTKSFETTENASIARKLRIKNKISQVKAAEAAREAEPQTILYLDEKGGLHDKLYNGLWRMLGY